MKLRYTVRGAAELDKVLSAMAQQSPVGARSVQARIQATINLLLQHPKAGRVTSNGRMRRIVATPHPYLIFYSTTDGEVIIHGVRHGARNPSSLPV